MASAYLPCQLCVATHGCLIGIRAGTIVKIYHDMLEYADAIHVEEFASQIMGFESTNGIVLAVLVFAFALLVSVPYDGFRGVEIHRVHRSTNSLELDLRVVLAAHPRAGHADDLLGDRLEDGPEVLT